LPGCSEHWGDRGVPRLRRGTPSVGGYGGHVGAPISIVGYGGHVGAPMSLIRQRQQLHGDSALAGIGHLRVIEDAEPDGLDARQLDSLLHQIAPHRLHATLAQLDVVLARPLRVGVALEFDHQLRVLLELTDEGDERRLSAIVELDAATQALSRAQATASALGARRILWQILASLASVEDARGHAVSSARTREKARSIAAGIEDSLRSVGLAERFRAQAVVQELMAAEGRPV